MTRYRNGQIPASVLVKIDSGTNGDGYWEHMLSPSQKRKHDALVARAKARTGRTLRITSGWNGYRPLDAQWTAKRKYGSGAAWPGTSSHGGTYKGADAMAMDYGNWSWVYSGDRAAFFADCRAVGLDPGVIPSESWHVIDRDPWAAVPTATPIPPSLPIILNRKEPDVATGVIYTDDKTDKARSGAIVNTESGLFSPFGWFPKAYANNLAKGFGLPQAGQVTRGQYDQIRADMADLRALRKS